MEELMNKVDNLIIELDKTDLIKKIRESTEEIKKEKELLEDIKNYQVNMVLVVMPKCIIKTINIKTF